MTNSNSETKRKALTYTTVILLVIAGWIVGGDYLSLSNIQEQLGFLTTQFDGQPIIFITLFSLAYILVVALFIPGSFIMNLLAGAIFGPLWGILLAAVSCTLGSLLGFFISRHVVANWVHKRFPAKSKSFSVLLSQNGWTNIFMLRIAPALPVGLTNFLAGVTRIPVWVFASATFIGMVPWIAFYVFAGVELASVQSISDLGNPKMSLLAGAMIIMITIGRLIARKLAAD